MEGLPALGKTTLVNLLSSCGYKVVNESLGHLSPIHKNGDQREIFLETVQKYQNTLGYKRAVIDRGYPSLLAWDYCAEKLGYSKNLLEKENWINEALENGKIFEPSLYIYFLGSPSLSLERRSRTESKQDVWSGKKGLEYCTEFYNDFFNRPRIRSITLQIDSKLSTGEIFEEVSNSLI
jgi:thymidylate kinase